MFFIFAQISIMLGEQPALEIESVKIVVDVKDLNSKYVYVHNLNGLHFLFPISLLSVDFVFKTVYVLQGYS